MDLDDNWEMLELLRKIDRSSRRQTYTGYARCALSLVLVVCAVVLVSMVYRLMPQVNAILGQVDTVLAQSQTVMGNLEQTSRQLASVDLESMVSNIDTLVLSGQQSLEQSMEKLNGIDLEALNQAIEDLRKAIEPLAKLSGMFR